MSSFLLGIFYSIPLVYPGYWLKTPAPAHTLDTPSKNKILNLHSTPAAEQEQSRSRAVSTKVLVLTDSEAVLVAWTVKKMTIINSKMLKNRWKYSNT